jgi:hypothetical protein
VYDIHPNAWKKNSANFALREFQEVAHRASGSGIMVVVERVKASSTLLLGWRRKERTMHKMRTARRVAQPKFGAQVAFARVATGLAWTGLGALAVGASAAGAMAIGALAIRALAVKRGRIGRLDIEELEVGRLHVRELVVEQEQRPLVEQGQTPPPPPPQASE